MRRRLRGGRRPAGDLKGQTKAYEAWRDLADTSYLQPVNKVGRYLLVPRRTYQGEEPVNNQRRAQSHSSAL